MVATGPLEGVRVLDLSQNLAGPFCSMLLADLGAEVVKVEPPDGGDNARSFGPPFVNGVSAGFLTLNRNKRSIVLDLKRSEAAPIIAKLLARSDVFIETFRPGVAERIGLGHVSVSKIQPRIVYGSVNGFGAVSPYAQRPGLDLIAQGMSGIQSVTGEPHGPPVKAGVPVTDLAAGMLIANGIMAALYERQRTGVGQRVEVSLLDAGLALSVWEFSGYLASGKRPERTGSAHRLAAPYEAFPTEDGMVNIGAPSQRLWERLCEVLGAPELVDDDRFSDNPSRLMNRAELAAAISALTRRLPTRDLVALLETAGVPCGPILSYDAVARDPHLVARDMVVQQDHPIAGNVRVIGVPLKFSRTPASVRAPAPTLGQDTSDVLGELGYTDHEIAALIASRVTVA